MSFVLSRWFPEVQNIYSKGNKKKQLPTGKSSAKLDSFFNCAATLMTLQLQDLILVSMQDFTDLIAQPPVSPAQLAGVPLKGVPFQKGNWQGSFSDEIAGCNRIFRSITLAC